MPVHIIRQDITKMHVDAIVNAANHTLLGGGGVDGAIHRAAGPKLLAECRTLHGCDTGDAKITRAYDLPARYVIHTVGPVWHGGSRGEEAQLISCYERSLALARWNGCRSVAFPLISSGAFGYPKDQALRVAEDTIRRFLEDGGPDMDVYIVIFDRASYRIGASLYSELKQYIDDRYTEDYDRRERFRRSALMQGPVAPMQAPGTRRSAARRNAPPQAAEWLHDAAAMQESRGELQDMLDDLAEKSFAERLLGLIDEAGITDAQCYRKANVDRRLFSKIRSNPDYRPSKPTALSFAIALRLPLDKTRELLESAGYALTHSSRSDIIVEYFIERGDYDVLKINEALFAFDLQPLSGRDAQ